MRTTYTPTPDVADRIYDLAKKSKKSLNAIINELVRKGLRDDNLVKETVRPYNVDDYSKHLGIMPGIDEDRLTKVALEMEDQEWLERHGNS
ncbi:MAG: hypothetical protein WCG75_07575 [Armatimonadota bacterium]